jgi:Xaa-Pro aminopeptidase
MEKRGIESLIVFGDQTLGNPDLAYVAGTSLARGGIYVKGRGRSPTLIVSNIDMGSAKQGRVDRIRSYSEYGYEKIQSKYDRDEARARFYHKLVRAEGLRSPAVVAGRNDSSNTLYLVDSLRKMGLRVVGEKSPTLLESARETKDRKEIDRLRDIGKKTCWVVKETVKFLRTAQVKGSKVTHKSKPITVGDVKKVIGRLLVQQGLVATEETIFAAGKGGSDPHYHGLPEDPIRPREPIIFDIFPSEPEGYWHDTTRTLIYGNPLPKVKEMYDAVLEAQDMALDMVKQGARCSDLMNNVCKHFEKRGYPTARQLVKGNKEARTRGFMHGLGHGVGLTIGERPYLVLFGSDTLRRGSVVTIEPGLYDPKYGGVRLEDIMVVGSPSEDLTSLPRDMEL